MKKLLMCSIIIIFLGINLFVSTISAAVPKIEPYVNDFADLLTPQEELNLNLYLDAIEQNTTWEIAIVTVLNTGGEDRVSFANKIGDENGVGKLNQDNGIVVLYSLDDDSGGAIATGRYSESIFNDAKVGRIGRENKHFFDDGDYYDGFIGIIQSLESEIQNPIGLNQNNNVDNTLENSSNFSDNLFILILAILAIIAFLIINRPDNSSYFSTSGVYVSSGRSSSSGSFGGSSFGGGSFGGGGGKF